jgi:hypothetical protein
MAWDKVTKLDSIAKRRPHSRVNTGKLGEYVAAYHRVARTELCRDTGAQRMVVIGKSGKMRRIVSHGNGTLSTSWPK